MFRTIKQGKKKKKRKKADKNKLSFLGGDEDEELIAEPAEDDTPRRVGKNPDVDTTFLPDRDRAMEEARQKTELKMEWIKDQEKMKSAPCHTTNFACVRACVLACVCACVRACVRYGFWRQLAVRAFACAQALRWRSRTVTGMATATASLARRAPQRPPTPVSPNRAATQSGGGWATGALVSWRLTRSRARLCLLVQITQGASIATFLREVQKEFKELGGQSVDNIMYIKEDLIIPHVRPRAARPCPFEQ